MSGSSISAVTECEVCGHRLPPASLDLGMQPLCDDLVPIGDSARVETFPIQISLCPTCLTAHQLFSIRKETLFPKQYHYRARFTQDVLNGMGELVADCKNLVKSLDGKLVCDIGCNDGSLLSIFRRNGAATVGIEPTGAADDAISAGHRVFNNYLTVQAAKALRAELGRPDIITFTNVFAHIESLSEAIDSLLELVDTKTLVIIENHYLGAVLEKNQFDTFYHEHPRTYSLRSFENIANRLHGNIVSVEFPKRYGGNIRVIISNFGSGEERSHFISSQVPDESAFPRQLAALQGFYDHWKADTRRAIDAIALTQAKLYGKSFPGRAAILINALRLDSKLQPKIFEKAGSIKLGHYIPGTDIEIASDAEWIKNPALADSMIIWAWHIVDEVALYMRANGFKGKLFTPLPSFREVTNI